MRQEPTTRRMVSRVSEGARRLKTETACASLPIGGCRRRLAAAKRISRAAFSGVLRAIHRVNRSETT